MLLISIIILVLSALSIKDKYELDRIVVPDPISNVVVGNTTDKFLIVVLLYNKFAPLGLPPLLKFKFVKPVKNYLVVYLIMIIWFVMN